MTFPAPTPRWWRRRPLLLATGLLAVLAGVATGPWLAPASAAPCRSAAPRHSVVTAVTNMACADAVRDLTIYSRPVAPSFRTTAGFTCTRTFRHTRAAGFRCVNGARVYRFHRTGRVRPAVRLIGGTFDGTFTVARCRTRGRTDLRLSGRSGGGLRLSIRAAPRAAGTLRFQGIDPENGFDATGRVSSLTVGGNGSIVAAGNFVAGGTGPFRVVGECR